MHTQRSVLFVDDDKNLLAAFRRSLRSRWDVACAASAVEGLQSLKERTHPVVVCDMRMPTLDGVGFIQCARKIAPLSVFVMLTGNQDQGTAVAAVNQGQVFRFLTKPCSTDEVERVLLDAIGQYDVRDAERDLLDNTLKGAVGALVDLLEAVRPQAVRGGRELADIARLIARQLGVADTWQIEVAAMLLHIGVVTLDDDLVDRAEAGKTLLKAEADEYRCYAAAGARIVRQIPRLDGVADLIERHLEAPSNGDSPTDQERRVLAAAMLLLDERRAGGSLQALLTRRAQDLSALGEEIVAAVRSMDHAAAGFAEQPAPVDVSVDQLRTGMLLCDDLSTESGHLLLRGGSRLSETLIERLRNYAARGAIPRQFRVEAPPSR